MIQHTFRIDGMHCDGCVRRVLSALQTLPGVQVEEVAVGRATVKIDPGKTNQAQLITALDGAGYRAREEGKG